MKTMAEKEARSAQIKECLNRRAEINARIKTIELERTALIAASRVSGELELAWRQKIDYHCQEFIHELSARSSDGRIPHIKFDTPSANVFINREKWLAAVPELVAACSSGSRMDEGEYQRRLAAIATEMLQLEQELRKL